MSRLFWKWGKSIFEKNEDNDKYIKLNMFFLFVNNLQ